MAQSHLEQYSIADFLNFRRSDRLDLNPNFQRRSVWSSTAKVYLIDTILRQMPMPKIYLRTTIDPSTQTVTRDVVDGQQRLRAIFEFADNKLRLTNRAGEFAGLRYQDLGDEYQAAFLGYTIGVDQLLNASDSAVLEVFARLNSYTVSLNPAELRHAEFQSDWKWTIHEAARRWETLWSDFGLLSVRSRSRMLDDALFAEFYLLISQGLFSGENRYVTAAYRHFERSGLPELGNVGSMVDATLNKLVTRLPEAIVGPLANPPHFLMMFAATAHVLHGLGQYPVLSIPTAEDLPNPPAPPSTQDAWDAVRDSLLELGRLLETPSPGPESPSDRAFWSASRGATVSLNKRVARFPYYLDCFE